MLGRSNRKKKGIRSHGSSAGDEESIRDLGIDVIDLDADGDDFSELDDDSVPKGKDRNFEFTDSLAVIRLARMFIFLQVLSLVVDNPSIQLPIIFRIANRGPLYYVGRFYSRIVIDFLYGFELLLGILRYGAKGLPAEPSGILVETPQAPDTSGLTNGAGNAAGGAAGSAGSVAGGGGRAMMEQTFASRLFNRALSASSYEFVSPKVAKFGATANFTSERDWHSIKAFSHFFLSALFACLAVVFVLHIWEIKDYTDRKEVREWLRDFIADGWWRRGLLKTIWGLCQCCFAMLIFAFGLFAVARQLNVNSLPEDSYVGSGLAILGSILFTYWVIGYMALRSTEVTFVRYVSQNVSYTSSIILKRVVKAKVDIALVFMFIMYMPALHIFIQSFFPIMDWNQYYALPHRKDVNFYVPCYFMAFPPWTEIHRSPDTCPVADSISSDQPPRARGFYRDRSILSCDSYLGVSFFTAGVFFFVFLSVSYFWLWSSFISNVKTEFQNSRFVVPLKTLLSIREESLKEYRANFNFVERWLLELGYEGSSQLGFLVQAVRFLVEQPIIVTKAILRMSYTPIMIAISPVTMIFNTFFSVCCESFTFEARKRKVREAAREKRREMAKYKELTGDDFEFSEGEEVEEEEKIVVRPISQIISDTLFWLALHFNPIAIVYTTLTILKERIKYQYNHSSLVAEVKVLMAEAREMVSGFTKKSAGGSKAKGLISLGGAAGSWRVALSLASKRKQIENLTRHVTAALRKARTEFISDHALTITVFDKVIDSSGLFMLICQYRYDRLPFTILLWFEMTLYAVVAAVSNYHVDWQTRTQYLLAISCIFGFITYLVKPFTEDSDRWFDFAGRVMVVITCGGILFCYSNTPAGKYSAVSAKMYDAQSSLSFLTSMSTLTSLAGLVDVVISLYMYFYIIYIVHYVGIFHAISRKIRSLTYGMHDHILDFLMHKLDERTIGAENMYTGLMVAQQWDDIIREQRRGALFPWPDVRPPDLLPVTAKLIEIKWAAMFNLNLQNLRSSLGLTLLHTTMCTADGEVVRWLIHLYPELLNVEDFQKDTPIFIALKECAFFLLKFGNQNEGELEDGTSYRDDEFLSYYPEIEQYREEAADYGEYLGEFADTYKLDGIEVRFLQENGYLVETKDTDKANYVPTFRVFKSKLGKFATQDEIEAEKIAKAKFDEDNKKFQGGDAEQETDPEKIAEARRQQLRKEAKALASEKASLYRKRFPDDDFQDNFESGQMAAWKILGLDVPDVNLFVDSKTAYFHSAEFGDGQQGFAAQEQVEVNLDARYVVKSYNSMPVPADTIKNTRTGMLPEVKELPVGHPALKDMHDWEYVRKKRRGQRSLLTAMADTKEVLRVVGRALGSGAVTLAQRQAQDRDVRYKLCKFAEIFLSAEILESVKVMKWDSHAYKQLNIMASKDQGRLAQNLAMACAMNPPPGFTRISEWTLGISTNVFDEHPDDEPGRLMKGALVAGDTVKQFHSAVVSVLPRRGSRRVGQGPRNHGELDYNRLGKMSHQTDPFTDRVIHYLAECVVSCRNRLQLSDCELSACGRYGWRAIVRALRRNNCTFIMPSVFVGTKDIFCTHLDLSRNELDCGDAVLISDVLLYKQSMVLLDLSYNRIGSRGFIRMCKAMKGHENISVLKLNHNRIGPAAGREIGILLKNNSSLRVMDFAHNRMGELIRWPTLLSRERIISAGRDIFHGLRANKSLEVLDLSYNHLGPNLAEYIPVSIMRHPTLYSLNISGNSLGPVVGPSLLFRLAGEPGGDLKIAEKERIEKECLEMIKQGIDPIEEMNNRKAKEEAEAAKNGTKKKGKGKSVKAKGTPGSPGSLSGSLGGSLAADDSTLLDGGADDGMPTVCRLVLLFIADNQLGYMAGYGAGALAINSKTLTALDLSGNALGYRGGVAFADCLEKCFGLEPRLPEKLTLYKLDQQKYEGRDAIPKPLIYTNLCSLGIARNGVGPLGCQGLMYCLAAPNCTLTSVDVSNNPLGYSIENGGDATLAGLDMRTTMHMARSMTALDLSRTSLLPVEMVPILGGLSRNRALRQLIIADVNIDEPSCLQLANGLSHCKSLRRFHLRNTKIGPKGALIIMNRVDFWGKHIVDLDLSGNNIGPIAMIPLGEILQDAKCAFRRFNIAGNDIMDEGALYIIRGLKLNGTVTDVDISQNMLTGESAEILSDVARGLYRDGHKINDCVVKKIIISDNDFGAEGCRMLTKAFTSSNFQHLEMANCGAGASSARIIANAMRDVLTHWRVLDVRGNNLGRQGMNNMFWALRQNRSLRSLLMGENMAGPLLGSDEDALLGHGVAIQRALRANVVLRELDLSYSGIDSRGGINIFEAMVENYTIRKISLRGNVLDDETYEALANFFRYNNVVEDVDLGENRLGYQCCFSIAEALECNRSVQRLVVDYNNLSAAGPITLEAFVRCLSMNTSMRVLIMDGNKLGSEWGVKLADALARNNTLFKVSLRDSRFDERAGRALLNCFKHAPFMMELALSMDEVGEKIWEDFRAEFNRKRAYVGPEDGIEETTVQEETGDMLEAYYKLD